MSPQYGSLTHEDIQKFFRVVLNTAKPEHPYKSDPYPISSDKIVYSYKKSSSDYYASCGARNGYYTVSFSADKTYFNNCEPERILAILTHEISHITVGSHTKEEGGSHPPRFWRKVGFNAHILLDNWDIIQETFGNVSKTTFIGYIVSSEITSDNADQRYRSISKQRQIFASWFKTTL